MIRNDTPISERYRMAALDWVAMDAAARMLEEGKTTYLAQQKALLGDMPDSKAERMVKSSPEWADYIKKMVNSKTAANRQRVELDFLKMRHMERSSEEATARAERKL
jgi:hypothetical protein